MIALFSEYDTTTGEMTGTVVTCASAPEPATGRGWVYGKHCRHRSIVVAGRVEQREPVPPVAAPGPGLSWAWDDDASEWVAVMSYEGKCDAVRAERASKMAEFDWMTLRKIRTGEPIPPIVLEYMQSLADITNQPGFPFDIAWPAKPGN